MSTRTRSRRGVTSLLLACLTGIVLCAAPALVLAHGDTVRVAYSSVKPERLVVKAGTTVHFHNANASGAPCTIVFADGATESPVLGRAEGWHHTFDSPGEYRFQLKEYPSQTGLIVVVAP